MHSLSFAAFFCVLPVAVNAQMVTEMTPDRVKEAVAEGRALKEEKVYSLSRSSAYCIFSTPYNRVRSAAFEAKKQYRDFAETDVTPNMLAPEARFFCPSIAINQTGLRRANPTTAVIIEKGKPEPIRPTSVELSPEKFSNAFGAKAEGEGMVVSFPLAVLKAGSEFHVVYDAKVAPGNLKKGLAGLSGVSKGCDDCAMEISLDKVR